MSLLKTWEVYKNELEQPKQIYLRKSDGINYCFDVNRGLLPCEWKESLWSTIKTDDEWELVRKPTDFMTAANSGRQFKPESWLFGGDEEFRNLYYNLQMFSGRELVQTKILNGKWLVE